MRGEGGASKRENHFIYLFFLIVLNHELELNDFTDLLLSPMLKYNLIQIVGNCTLALIHHHQDSTDSALFSIIL